jgi:hypothetical protein
MLGMHSMDPLHFKVELRWFPLAVLFIGPASGKDESDD